MGALLKISQSQPSMLCALLSVFMVSGCATIYKRIHPDQIEMVNAQNTLYEDSIQIWWITNVYHDTGNRRYAKRESKTGISLAVVRIRNHSLEQRILPDDLVFLNEFEEPVWPLSLEEALDALTEPISFKDPAVEVDSGLWRLGRTTNDAIKIKSRIDFIDEMYNWYLVDRIAKSGHLQTGLIVLPVPTSTQWTIRLRERN